MEKKIDPKVNLRLRYKKVIQFALAFSLLLCILTFQAFKKFDHEKASWEIKLDKIVAEEIPQTIQEKLSTPPARPAIPIESESEDVPDNVTIEDTNIEFDRLPERPSEPVVEQEDGFVFVAYDDPPKPVGGFQELAQKAGIQGTVVVQARISEKGEVIDTRIIVPLGNSGCNEAAVAAIKAAKWEPAKQRDKPVTVWISIPIRFKLK
jgi:protein TonB